LNLNKEALVNVVYLCRLRSFEIRFFTLGLAHTGVDECLLISWVEKKTIVLFL